MQKRIVFILVAAVWLLATTGSVLAADQLPAANPAIVAVSEVRVEKGQGQNEFVFSAAVSGVTAKDSRYQVLLELARTDNEFSEGDAKLFTPMVWDDQEKVWTATRTVDKFSRDKIRRYRVVVREAVSGTSVAVGQDDILRDPGKAPPISRQEALEFLNLLSSRYSTKNYAGFMELVSPDFAGDDFILSNAVRKDFRLLNDIDIRFMVTAMTANADFATIQANYRRSVTPTGTGTRLNDSGLTELMLYKEKGQLKLYSMKKPLLFGIANNGAAATGIVLSGQNQNVTQIKKDGTVIVGSLTSTSPPVKTVILNNQQYSYNGVTPSVYKFLNIATGDVTSSSSKTFTQGDFFIDAGFGEPYIVNIINFNCGWKRLPAIDINSVKNVPDSGYTTGFSGDMVINGMAVFALHLNNGNYAVVEVANCQNTVDNSNDILRYSVTVLYKYQSDGTRNF